MLDFAQTANIHIWTRERFCHSSELPNVQVGRLWLWWNSQGSETLILNMAVPISTTHIQSINTLFQVKEFLYMPSFCGPDCWFVRICICMVHIHVCRHVHKYAVAQEHIHAYICGGRSLTSCVFHDCCIFIYWGKIPHWNLISWILLVQLASLPQGCLLYISHSIKL